MLSEPLATSAVSAPKQRYPALPDRVFNLEVVNVSVKELLYALARDANIEADIHPEIDEKVSLIAKDQSFVQILDRLLAMVPIRVQLNTNRLIVEPDRPYQQRYSVDYLNIHRTLMLKTQVASSLLTQSAGGVRATEQENNRSSLMLQGGVENQFWLRLQGAVCQVLLSAPSRWHEAKCSGVLDKGEGGDVTLYPEVGLLVVYGTQRQQREVAAFIAEVTRHAKRQVLIEATLIEVELNEGYEAGVDWSLLMGSGKVGSQLLANNLAVPPFVFFSRSDSHRLQGIIKALEAFGHTKVLSSPRVMALNNQTAVLKVVNEEVYFTLHIKEDFTRNGAVKQQKFESQLHTVPVGLVMNVTPQIAAEGVVTLHVRPSITSIGGYKEDPAVSLYAATQSSPVKSQVPILQVREFDSMLSIPDQHIAILGGLIRDDQRVGTESIPFLGRIPLLGGLFQYQNRRKKKSELVIFLRPQIVDYAPAQTVRQPHLVTDIDSPLQQTQEYRDGQ